MKLLLLSVLLSFPCFAQAVLTPTLNGGITSTATTLTLSDSTAVGPIFGRVRTGLYIDREYIEVVSNVSPNVWTVRRAAGGYRSAHASGATVYVGRPDDFSRSQTNPSGDCRPGAQALPLVVIATGDVFDCPVATGQWALLTPARDMVTLDPSGTLTVGTPLPATSPPAGSLNVQGNLYQNGALFSGGGGSSVANPFSSILSTLTYSAASGMPCLSGTITAAQIAALGAVTSGNISLATVTEPFSMLTTFGFEGTIFTATGTLAASIGTASTVAFYMPVVNLKQASPVVTFGGSGLIAAASGTTVISANFVAANVLSGVGGGPLSVKVCGGSI